MSNTELVTVASPAELTNFWRVLTLTFVDVDSPVWYDFHTLQPFKSLPHGKLQFVDVQVRDFNNRLTYTLLVGLTNREHMLLLCLDLHSAAALSLIEPLCLLPTDFLDCYFVLRHQFVPLGNDADLNNTCIRFKVQCGKAVLNAPLSSLAGWQSVCFRRLKQLQAKLQNYTPRDYEDYEFELGE